MKNVSTNLSNLKNKIYKLDVDKLVLAPVDLSKLSDVIKNDVVKKDVYNAKIKNIKVKIIATNLATNTTLNTKTNKIRKEIPNITKLATTTPLHAKINKIKKKIPNITNLTTTTALTAKVSEIENKITTDHDHDKYITTQKFNDLASENFCARLAQANLESKSDTSNFVKK